MQQPSCSLHDLAIKVLLPSPSSTLQSEARALLNAIMAAAATVGDDFEKLDRAAFALMTNSVSRVSVIDMLHNFFNMLYSKNICLFFCLFV